MWYLLKKGQPFGNYANIMEFMVDSAADILTPPTDKYAPGSVAHTPGYKEAWEADADGNWIPRGSDLGKLKIYISNYTNGPAPSRVESLTETQLYTEGNIVDVVGIPEYVENPATKAAYAITESGWYVFARITSSDGVTIGDEFSIEGYDGLVTPTQGDNSVDIAVRFDTAALARTVSIHWNEDFDDVYVFRANDLAIRNLDYRTTFYIYDAAPYATYTYALTTDTTFAADKNYYVLDNGEYTLAEVTAGESVAENTYYNHSKITFSGLVRNVTYKYDPIIDCPMEFILPEIEDETHGCWFEIRCQHAGEYSMTLVPPSSDVKVATEHTQKETAGINMIDLHYTYINNTKLWRFMNTHSSIPT